MKKITSLLLIYLIGMVGTAKATQVRFELPKKPEACNDSALSRIYNFRPMAFVASSFFGGWKFYDLNEKCMLTVKGMNDMSISIVNGKLPGDVFIVYAFLSNGAIAVDVARAENSDDGDYTKWRAAERANEQKEKEAKKKAIEEAEIYKSQLREEKRLNSTVLLSIPIYTNADENLKVVFVDDKLTMTNNTKEFVTISSISAYYNDKINTLSRFNYELPPESTTTNGVYYNQLFSDEMRNSREIKVKNIEIVKADKTKFGFAIKYLINGIEHKMYQVNEYKNDTLLKTANH